MNEPTTHSLDVQGMSCSHCVRAVREAAMTVPGVTEATVDLESARASVTGEGVDTLALIAAIEAEGYRARLA